jgi:hypothetical protein
MQDLEYTGMWWLPEAPDTTVGGTLSFSQERGAQLALIGALQEDEPLELLIMGSSQKKHPIILGLTDKGASVTLQDCVFSGSQVNSEGFVSQRFRANVVYIGVHFSETDQATVSMVEVQYSHLAEWNQRSGFAWDLPTKQGNYDFTLRYNHPEERIAHVPFGDLIITTSISINPGSFTPRIRQTTLLQIKTVKPLSLEEIFQLAISPFQVLLNFATVRSNAIKDVKLHVTKSTDDGEQRMVKVSAYFSSIRPTEDDQEEIHPYECLFTANDISNFDSFMNRWLELINKYGSVIRSLASPQQFDHRNIKVRVLHLGSLLEGYFARSDVAIIGNPNDVQQQLSSILSKLSRKQRAFLEPYITDYKVPLRFALQALIERANDVVLPIIKDTKAFTDLAIGAINTYSHLPDDVRGEQSRVVELYWIAETLFIILQRNILEELGFSDKQCQQLFNDYRRYLNIRTNADFPW